MKKNYMLFLVLSLCSPLIFYFYLINDLVCLPRAIYSESIFSFAPLTIISIGYWLKNKKVILSAIGVPVIVIIITPIIMLNRLGWDKFFNDRLLAFFTFEGIAIIQIILILKMIKSFKK